MIRRDELLQSRRIPAALRFLSRRGLKELARVLEDGEEVVRIEAGRRKGRAGLLAATTRRVVWVQTGPLRSRMRWNEPYRDLERVEGGRDEDGDGAVRLRTGPGWRTVTGLHRERAQEMARVIEERRQGVSGTASFQLDEEEGEGADDADAKRQRLERMRDRGSVTQAEYERIRARLERPDDRPVMSDRKASDEPVRWD